MSRILIAEDEERLRTLYKEELEEDGYEVLVAANGQEALDLFHRERPDLVILDIRMPGMDGLEVMGIMLSEKNEIPVILHTAFSTYQDDFHSWAADAYVVKSSDLAELKGEIQRLLAEGNKPAGDEGG